METIREVLNRLLKTPLRGQTGAPASKLRDLRPGSALVPLGTLPMRRSEVSGDEPLFTADDLRKLGEFVKTYADGYVLLRQLEGTASRPGLSDSEAMLVTRLVRETLALIEPFEPVIVALTRFCSKQARVEMIRRECDDEISKLEVNLKLDCLLSGLDRLERRIQERSVEKPISPVDELFKQVFTLN